MNQLQQAQTIPLTNILDVDDPVTHYATEVVNGSIVAGPHVRAACERHLRDLIHGPARGLVWDVERARYAIGFFPDVLVLNGGRFEGKPFHPELWQGFIIGSALGWIWEATGYRRFQIIYVETAKGSGKSPLAAGIGLYGLVADGEQRAEIYAAATSKDQAQILFRDAVSMVDQSPELDWRLVRSGSKGKENNLAYHDTNSFFRPIAAGEGQSGPRPHMGLLDEIHEHRDGTVVEMIRAGFKFRTQPMLVMITNSGTNKKTVCWEYHQFGAEVCAGVREDDTFFAYICALDDGDDPFVDESCWIKANPNLGVTIEYKYLRDQVTQARGMPAKESLVKRLNFCIWTEALSPWISYHVWKDCSDPEYGREELRGRRCYGGLDLSSTTDLTAFALAFEPTPMDPYWRVITFFWIPEEGIIEKAELDRVEYPVWRDRGFLETTPGSAISKLFVLKRIVQLAAFFDLQAISFDRWRIEDLKQLAVDEGITLPQMVPFGQGYKDMAPALDEFETLLKNQQLRHDGNPVMTWCAANAVVVFDPAGNRKVSKEKAIGRVDGVVAGIMAIGCVAKMDKKPEPEYKIFFV